MSLSPCSARYSAPWSACAAIVTRRYVPTRMKTEMTVARPGCSVGFPLSSFTDAVVSQPQ